jgi:hypothetical protein
VEYKFYIDGRQDGMVDTIEIGKYISMDDIKGQVFP